MSFPGHEAIVQDKNCVYAQPAAHQMNYPPMARQWNGPQHAPGNNAPPTSQMWNVLPAQQFINPPNTQQWNIPPLVMIPQNTQSTVFHQIFLKGKPKALGIVLIVVAILQIGLGIGMFFTASYLTLISGIPFWGSIFYIIAGSLSVAAHSKSSVCLVKGSLGLNIISSIFSFLGFILSCIDFSINYWYIFDCRYYDCNQIITAGQVIRSIFLVTYLLIFSVSISISAFACRALEHPPTNAPQIFVMQNDAAGSIPPSAYARPFPAFVQSPTAPTFHMAQGGVQGGPIP